MAKNVVMPALEMAQETGTIVSWLKKEGDTVTKGEPLLEIETDKATVEIEALANGVLAGVKAAEGEEVPVGQTIAWIVAPGEEPPAESEDAVSGRTMSQKPRAGSGSSAPAAKASAGGQKKKTGGGGKVSPKARRLAKEHGVDLSTVEGKGPDGAITGEDVLAAAKSPSSGDAKSATPALGVVARLMAERTTQSWNEAPHFFLTRHVDATALNALRAKVREGIEADKGVKVTHTDILVALIGHVLVSHPKMNASWDGKGIRFNQEVNVCIAMAVEDGVVSPVVAEANLADLGDIALRRRDLAERARSGKLRPADITGGNFTISNLGMFSIDAFTAIIVPPQAAILAVGAIADRVVPVDGQPGIRPIMTLTLSSDHRVVDGAQAAIFLNDLVKAIEDPQSVL
jgi:pyruvate dehydrogenase E2 component (dihydrolipoamide acetyltransferase)